MWNGQARTYDLKGKRFAICMAGNPYTESGARFKIPDMLANRADTYNLGDMLQGKDEAFALELPRKRAHLERGAVAARRPSPAGREAARRHGAGRRGAGRPARVPYSGHELEEILAVLRQLLKLRQVVLRVNQEYIRSAAQDDQYRSEPKFQLQGSYRNMNKMAEKVAAVMNADELEALIDDHYRGEAQTLTTGAEQNLLKLAEIRGRQSDEQKTQMGRDQRGFQRIQVMGGKEEDPAVRVLGQLSVLGERLHAIDKTLGASRPEAAGGGRDGPTGRKLRLEPVAEKLEKAMGQLAQGLAAALEPRSRHRRHRRSRAGVRQPAQVAAPAPAPVIAPVIDLVGVAEILQPYLERLDFTLKAFATAGAASGGHGAGFSRRWSR